MDNVIQKTLYMVSIKFVQPDTKFITTNYIAHYGNANLITGARLFSDKKLAEQAAASKVNSHTKVFITELYVGGTEELVYRKNYTIQHSSHSI